MLGSYLLTTYSEIAEKSSFLTSKIASVQTQKVSADKGTGDLAQTESLLSNAVTKAAEVTERIQALEQQLLIANQQLSELNEGKVGLEVLADEQRNTKKTCLDGLKVAQDETSAAQESLTQAVNMRQTAQQRYNEVVEVRAATAAETTRQRTYAELIAKKVERKRSESELLKMKVMDVDTKWARFKEDNEKDQTARNISKEMKSESKSESKSENNLGMRGGNTFSTMTSTPSPPTVARLVTDMGPMAQYLEDDDDLCFDFEEEKKEFRENENVKRRFGKN